MTLFCEVFGNTPTNSLTLKHLEKFKNSRKQAGVPHTTITIDIRTIKAAINVAVDMEDIGRNPFAKVKQLKQTSARTFCVSTNPAQFWKPSKRSGCTRFSPLMCSRV